MNRSTINKAYRDARECFARHYWALPPRPKWDITDFGLGNFDSVGLTLVNLATEPEYCEKVMYARRGQMTPCHSHIRKKEDIICRSGELIIQIWPERPEVKEIGTRVVCLQLDGFDRKVVAGEKIALRAGSRATLNPGLWHAFYPIGGECIIGEVSTGNDDVLDNIFIDPNVKRFSYINEDEPAIVTLIGEQ